jgi:hypothetical protein
MYNIDNCLFKFVRQLIYQTTNMKAFRLPLLFLTTLVITLSACEKNAENIKDVSEVRVATTSKVVYPLVGTDMSDSILPMRKLPKAILYKGYSYPHINVQQIDTVCEDYLQKTKKLDLSYLADGAVNHIIGKDDLTLYVDPDFVQGAFRKLSSGPKGWWTHWNYSPYAESENPIVLFAVDHRYGTKNPVNGMGISLGRAVTSFGFEIAPNSTGKDVKVLVTYNNYGGYRGQTMFAVEQTISSPSGARLIALKSNMPFTYVGIQLQDQKYPAEGFAIANIRYQLAD